MNHFSRKTLERALARARAEVDEARRNLSAAEHQVVLYRTVVERGLGEIVALQETLDTEVDDNA